MIRKFLLTLIICIPLGLTAQEKGLPDIRFEKERIYLANVDLHSKSTATFLFTNTGEDSLKIIKVRVGCKCTSVEFPDKPVPPGGNGKIFIEYEARNPGEFMESITVVTNTKKRWYPIYIRGEVKYE